MAKKLVIVVSFLLSLSIVRAQDLDNLLMSLDAAIQMSDTYNNNHSIRVKRIEEKISAVSSLEEAYSLYDELYYAQISYKFDLANSALDKKGEIALRLRDKQKISETALDRAFLYCVAGMYLESYDVISKVDSTLLSHNKLIDYYNYWQRFLFDFRENSADGDYLASEGSVSYYRQRIIEETSPTNPLNRLMRVREEMDLGRVAQADSLCNTFLSSMDENSHDYAELAYYKATCARMLGNTQEMLRYFTKSAIADIKSNTKDNASLQCLAVEFLNRGEEIDRAFKYTQYSLNDAVFFNAKLRPWQIAMSLPSIENAYVENNRKREKWTVVFVISLSIFALVMLILSLRFVSLYSKQKKAQRKISEMNKELQVALSDLEMANAAKEEYLGLFLSMCSTYIDKLKKHISYAEKEAELASFYKTFDNAFLQLYPDFVEKFNALLKPEARIELKKDESLNTELRIFALIKLGITQSSHIASLLRYSVNTIYNYRAQIKNAAIQGKDSFEESIKLI